MEMKDPAVQFEGEFPGGGFTFAAGELALHAPDAFNALLKYYSRFEARLLLLTNISLVATISAKCPMLV